MFIGDLIAINDGNEFENHYNKIYPPQLISKKENNSHKDYFFRPSSLYKRGLNPNILV